MLKSLTIYFASGLCDEINIKILTMQRYISQYDKQWLQKVNSRLETSLFGAKSPNRVEEVKDCLLNGN